MSDPANWRRSFTKRWGIKTSLPPDTAAYLWTSRCSETKSRRSKGVPKELYRSPLNLYFYRMLEASGRPYAIVSDKYGLHMDTEVRATYDVHPSTLSVVEKANLGEAIRKKLTKSGHKGIIFYNNSPLRSVPYLQILSFAQVPVFFTTRIRGLGVGD